MSTNQETCYPPTHHLPGRKSNLSDLVTFNCIQPPCQGSPPPAPPASVPFTIPTAPTGLAVPASFFSVPTFDPFRFSGALPGPLTMFDLANDPTLAAILLGQIPAALATGSAGMAPPDDTLMTDAELEVFNANVSEILSDPRSTTDIQEGISVAEGIALGLPPDFIETLRENERFAEQGRIAREGGTFGVVPDAPATATIDEPLPEESGRVSIGPTGLPEFLPGAGTVAGAPESDIPDAGSGEQPMADLSNILGTIGRAIGGSLDTDPATPGIFGGGLGTSLPDVLGGIGGVIGNIVGDGDTPSSNLPAIVNGGPTVSLPTISTREQVIAQQLGISAQQMALVKKFCRTRRRRRRMLTKSDIADISTMASLLGKSSEAFKTWLATQRLTR